MTQDEETERIYNHGYALFLAFFGAVSMFAQFLFAEIDVNTSKELFYQFNATYPKETKAFLWAFESSWQIIDDWWFVGLFSGIITLLLVFATIFLWVQAKREGKEIVPDFVVILIYLGIFSSVSYLLNPTILNRPSNLMYALVSSMICGASTHLLLLHDKLKRDRRKVNPKTSLNDFERDLRLKAYELEHVEYRQILHSLIWVFASLTAGIVFTTILQYVFALPLEIVSSTTFANFGISIISVFFLNSLGFFVGVLYQLMYEIHDIVNVIRDQAANLEESKQQTPKTEEEGNPTLFEQTKKRRKEQS